MTFYLNEHEIYNCTDSKLIDSPMDIIKLHVPVLICRLTISESQIGHRFVIITDVNRQSVQIGFVCVLYLFNRVIVCYTWY